MEKVQLSDNGPVISPIIYSFWRALENPDGVSLAAIENKVNLCLELGITTFDHADIYGNYEVEALFGKALKRKAFKREDIILSTKAGINAVDRSRPQYRIKHYDSSAEHLLESVKSSLSNLQTDYVDILLLHHPDPLMDPEETGAALTHLVSRGMVRHVGVANFSVHQHRLLQSRLSIPLVTNHLELNLLKTKPLEDGTLDFLKEIYSRPLAWAPLAGGRILDPNYEPAFEVRRALERVAPKYNANVEQLAIAWLLKLGALPIVGTNSEQRIRNATSAVGIQLDRQDWYEIYFAANANKAS